MQVADVDDVKAAGLLFDAGTTNSPSLMEVGPSHASASHTADPTSLHDVDFPVGGADVGKATTGLVVNRDNVTMYGLFVEHFHMYQTVWNGNGSRTYLFQTEMPYDPPNQAAWMNGSTQGYTADKGADAVIDNTGGPSNSFTSVPYLTTYP